MLRRDLPQGFSPPTCDRAARISFRGGLLRFVMLTRELPQGFSPPTCDRAARISFVDGLVKFVMLKTWASHRRRLPNVEPRLRDGAPDTSAPRLDAGARPAA